MPIKGEIENQLRGQFDLIIGVDEVGRGCIAGDTCAAAVVIEYDNLNRLDEKSKNLIRDSKLLSRLQRDKVSLILRNSICQNFAIESIAAAVIDSIGIQKAIFLAMRKAVFKILEGRTYHRVVVLVDGNLKIPDLTHESCTFDQRAIVKGDQLCYAIAAASILAKVTRDQTMHEAAKIYPLFGFENHMGYGTKQHLKALSDFGLTPLHRKSFAPVACYLN